MNVSFLLGFFAAFALTAVVTVVVVVFGLVKMLRHGSWLR